MPTDEGPFKNRFNTAFYAQMAETLQSLEPRFDRQQFLSLTLGGLEKRELKERLAQTAVAMNAALPGSFRDKLKIARALAPRLPHGLVTLSLCDFVAREGLGDFDLSMEALKFLTPFGSAEFAVRPFILLDPPRALKIMRQWAGDKNEHVRRLASEGSRPRLPWGSRLGPVVDNPALTEPILDALRKDPSPYVRKSVANHLNDISRDHPAWVLKKLAAWDCSVPETHWIAHHALRTLVKKGDPLALRFLGANTDSTDAVSVRRFTASPRRLRLGEALQLEAELLSRSAARLVVDYVIHYPRPSGKTSEKVFKWTVADLQPGKVLRVKKRQVIRDFTIRKHHPGRHRIELQINGRRLAESAFTLVR